MKNNRTKLLGSGSIIPIVCQDLGEPGLVSVLIPTFNRAYILGKTIESVLAQTYQPLEIIIVDDGSTDDTRTLIESFGTRVRYIYQENTGLAAARNMGLAAARGEFIAFQDSDDLWLPWKLQAQVALMQRFPELALIWTDMKAVSSDGVVIREKHLSKMYHVYQKLRIEDHLSHTGRLKDVDPDCPIELMEVSFRMGDIFSAMFMGNLVHPPTALIRRRHLSQVGGLDLAFSWTCEDYEFFWRVSQKGLGAVIEASSMLYRVNATDQLTKPGLHLYIARGNLIALKRRLENDRDRIRLPKHMIRHHLSEAYTWAAEEELLSDDGSRARAIGSFWRSLRLNPFQKRSLLLFLISLFVPRLLFAPMRFIKQKLKTSRLPIWSFIVYKTIDFSDLYLNSLFFEGI